MLYKPSQTCYNLITQWEGCRLEAYEDQGGRWTIGYGTTGPGIVEGLTISVNTAMSMMKDHANSIAQDLSHLGLRLTQNQLDALVCFIYNIGMGAFKSSTLLKKLLAQDAYGAAEEFPRWDKVHGVDNPGLLNRRKAEQTLFMQA